MPVISRKLVLDYNNGNIQLYDMNNTFLTETVLLVNEDEKCQSFVLNSSTEALVSTGSDRLFKVIIGDDLTVSEIKTNYRYKIYSMTKYGEDVLCVDSGQGQLCVIDKHMKKIIKTILKDDGTLFRAPWYLGVSADKNTIYVLDWWKGCYGITLDGQMFHYQNREARNYIGLVVDSDGLFIGSRVGSVMQIEKLNFSGERQEVCTIFGDSYPLKLMENQLVVFQVDDKCIRFYWLLK